MRTARIVTVPKISASLRTKPIEYLSNPNGRRKASTKNTHNPATIVSVLAISNCRKLLGYGCLNNFIIFNFKNRVIL